MSSNLSAVRSVPGRSFNITCCRHPGCNETETLGHVLGFCRKTELLRNNRHHKARTGIADVLKRRGWEVYEEIHCVSSLDSNRRADIAAIHRTQSKGLVLDPTIRFERDALQAQHVDEEKKSIYESCIPYLSEKYNIPTSQWSVSGLLFGARGTLPKFTFHCCTTTRVVYAIATRIDCRERTRHACEMKTKEAQVAFLHMSYSLQLNRFHIPVIQGWAPGANPNSKWGLSIFIRHGINAARCSVGKKGVEENWLFNDAVSTTWVIWRREIGDSELVSGEMRPSIRHRLPDIHFQLGETSEKTNQVISQAEIESAPERNFRPAGERLNRLSHTGGISRFIEEDSKKILGMRYWGKIAQDRQQWRGLIKDPEPAEEEIYELFLISNVDNKLYPSLAN
ncbi:hypothetical protein ANN_12487 [Periplaneta americana]|uniref:Uncharacterized protein n=1 Tax=Periplaneta americana TaxID=6978 RepID=A0ABQ8TJ74_PERAM|nr:hypothetical protein ANN_12487 [Periplaneta americana]